MRGDQWVPAGSPDHLDRVPAAPRKMPSSSWMIFPLPRRAVQALRVAVHHEDQVVQLLAAGQQIAQHSGSSISPSPRNAHVPVRGISQLPVGQVLEERAW